MTSLTDGSGNVSKDYISQVVQEELNKTEPTNGTDKIQIEVTNRESVFRRDYKLTPKSDMDSFMDYLTSELTVYVI